MYVRNILLCNDIHTYVASYQVCQGFFQRDDEALNIYLPPWFWLALLGIFHVKTCF